MHLHIFRALTLTTLAAALAAPAFAQVPGDDGLGIRRGIQGLNNSGQVGTVTAFRGDGGPQTAVMVRMHGTGDRVQTVTINRGRTCENFEAKAAYVLTPLSGGRSTSTVPINSDRLLSGNYMLIVMSSTAPDARPVACGQIYVS